MTNAQAWVGAATDEDKLDVAAIAAQLPPDAAALKGFLQHTKVKGLSDMRRKASQKAAAAQRNFKRLSAAAVVGTALATLASGLLLYGAGSESAAGSSNASFVQMVSQYKHAIITAQVIGLFVAAVATSLLGWENLIETWADHRRLAEAQRSEIFNQVITLAAEAVPAPLAAADAGNPLRQAFEFFRRYQLDLQVGFFNRSGGRHGTTGTALAWATALLAGFAAAAGALGGMGGTALVVSAFLGLGVPILLSAAQSWQAASRDREKAAAYEKAVAALETIQLDLDGARAAADRGEIAAVRDFVNRVHVALASENEAWVPAARK